MVIDWAVAERPLAGEHVSGDIHVVEPLPDGVLVAVIDALGHGADAAATSMVAAEAVRAYACEDVSALIRSCHAQLRSGRGVVISAAAFNARRSTLTWGGIGNVEGFVMRAGGGAGAREALVMRGGVVGFQIPEVRATVVPVAPGDVLVLATDGIASGFLESCDRPGTPQQMADRILQRYGKRTDDALVLVAAYRGAAT